MVEKKSFGEVVERTLPSMLLDMTFSCERVKRTSPGEMVKMTSTCEIVEIVEKASYGDG